MKKSLCRWALAAVFVAACGRDGAMTEPSAPMVPPPVTLGPDVLALGVDSTTGASIETNKDDYTPGEVVHVVGRGWAPGETVNLHMTEVPDTHADVDTNVVADTSGGFSVHYYDVQTHDIGVTFTLTATGQTSHGVAVVTFTDGNVSIKSSPAGVPSFTTGSYVKYNQSTSCGTGTTSPGVFSVNSSTFTVIVGINNNQSLSMTVPATLTGYTFSSWSVGSPGIVVSGSLTNPSGLCIRIPDSSDQPNVTVNYIVSNVPPVVNAGGPYSGAEGSAISLGGVGGATATDADASDVLTYKWTANTTGIDAGGVCTFSPSDLVLNPSVTCTDDSQGAPLGKFTLTLEVKDGAGGHTVTANADLTVNNVAPTATINAPSPVNPGQNFTLTLNGGTDLGTNDISALQYAFDCGDGAGYNVFGAANSRGCTASQPNSQTVKGKIRDQDGGENEYTTTISVNNAAPVANAGGNKTGVEGSPVTLSGTGSSDPDGTIITYAWTHAVVSADPGAGCIITNAGMATASIACDDDGSFTVTLTVTDDDGATNSQTVALTISNAPPVASAGGPYTVAEGSAIQLTASANDPGDNDDAGLTYAWTVNSAGIDPGGTCTLSNANIHNPTVSCTDDSNAGYFTVTVTVSDGDGGSDVETANLTVTNANPVANAQNASGAEASVIQLNSTGDDPGNNDDAGLTYSWTINFTGIDGGGTCSLVGANTQNPTVSCTDDSNNGTFTVSVTVSDDDGGSHTDNATLTVNNANPTANAGTSYSGVEGSPIQLAGSGDDPADNDDGALTYLWSVTTTVMDPGGACTFSDQTDKNATVTCNDDSNLGNILLKLKVMDDDGGYGTHTVNLSVSNANPSANPGGAYFGSEGSPIQLSGSGDDPGNNDDGVLTYHWTVNFSGIDGSGSCGLSSATAQNPTVTCNDDSNGGTFSVSLTVKDDDGGTSTTQSANLTVANVNPVADAGASYTGNEGANVSLTGSKSDAGSNDTHTYSWAWVAQSGVDPFASCSFTTATQLSPTVKCTDDGVFTLTLTVTDDDAGADPDDATLTLDNVAPTIAITSHLDGALFSLLNGPLSVTGAITEVGTNDKHDCRLELDGVLDEIGAYSPATGLTCSPSVLPDEAGVYTLTIRVKDDDGGEGTATIMIVVYDPSAGFVTGGGWINSPAGAYKPSLTLAGKATFGFVSKYKKGATVPEGNTEFQFHAGSMNFHSSTYQWLVVNQAGTNAQFKGTGTINGQGSYTFMLWATDYGNSGDTFRMQITDNNNSGAVVYDNGTNQVIAQGSIVIHTGK